MTTPHPHRPPAQEPYAGPPYPQYPQGPQYGQAPYPAQYPPAPTRQVTKSKKRTSHGLHLFLTIITCGLWGMLVWFPLTLWHKFGPKQKTVTTYQ